MPNKGNNINNNVKNNTNNNNNSNNNLLQTNLSQTGVKNSNQDNKKNGKEIIDSINNSSLSPNQSKDRDFSLSPPRTATINAASTSATSSSSTSTSTSQKSVTKDTKKNSIWQNRSISLPTEPALVSSIKKSVSNGNGNGSKIIYRKNVLDNNSDDGVGVSNSEIEDEWLEVKQKRAKGLSNGSTSIVPRGGGGPQATSSSTATASVKDAGSRSPSPIRPNGTSTGTGTGSGSGNGNGNDAVSSAAFTAIGSDSNNIDHSSASASASLSGPVPSSTVVTSSFSSPPVTSMGFKAAVLSRQQDTASSTSPPTPYLSSSLSQSLSSQSQSQAQVQTVLQPFSVLDFPAMPSSSMSHKSTIVHSPPPIILPTTSTPPPPPLAFLEVPTIPPAVPPPETLISASNPTKKTLKVKKKTVKAESDSVPDMNNLNISSAIHVNSAQNISSVGLDTHNGVSDKLLIDQSDVSIMITSNNQESSEISKDITAFSDVSLPSTYQLPALTMPGIHTSNTSNGNGNGNGNGALEGYVTVTDTRPCTGTAVSTQHTSNILQFNGQSNPRIPQNNNSNNNTNNNNSNNSINSNGRTHEYAYQNHPHADEENDDDLFKAISSAHAIDFDPSFTANSLSRSATSTLSPLSRRVGARNDVSLTHETLPMPVSAVNMHQITYSTSLLDPPGRVSPGTQPSAEDFLCGISFDFFSSLLDSSTPDIAPCRITRREGSLHDLAHSTSTCTPNPHPPLPLPHTHTKYPLLSSAIEGLQVNEYSPHCNDYQYRGPGIPDLNDDNYTESDSHSVRFQMPILTPIPPSELASLPPFTSADIINSSSNASTSHYNKMGILDLPQGIPVTTPQLFTARELCLATDNFSASHLMDTSESIFANNLQYHSSRLYLLNDEEKRREKEKVTSICTFTGILRHNMVVIKIVTPNTDSKINTDLQSQYLRELRVLSEITHPHILPLYGYTFRPYARVFLIPQRASAASVFKSDNLGNKRSQNGFLSLYSLLNNIERRKRLSWKMRIRIITCILMALSYLHAGDVEAGRCPIAHRYVMCFSLLCSALLYFRSYHFLYLL